MIAILILFAVLLGVAVTTQGHVNGMLSQRMPLSAAMLLNAVITLVGALLWWTLLPGAGRRLIPAGPTPWWLYSGGLLGLFIISSAAFCFPRLGAGATIALAVTAQLLAALACDHYGLMGARLPATPARLFGGALLVAGALLVLWPSYSARPLPALPVAPQLEDSE